MLDLVGNKAYNKDLPQTLVITSFFISSLFIIYKLIKNKLFIISTKTVLLALINKISLTSIFKFISSLGIIFSLVVKNIFFLVFLKFKQ